MNKVVWCEVVGSALQRNHSIGHNKCYKIILQGKVLVIHNVHSSGNVFLLIRKKTLDNRTRQCSAH